MDYNLESFNKNHIDVPFWVDGSLSGRYFYIQDHNKNVKGIMNYLGELMGGYDYSPFGQMVASSLNDITSGNPFRFSSEYYDGELGLYYYNYRHYNSADARWISRDPIAEQGGVNLYSFIDNDPNLESDFLGLAWEATKESKGKIHRDYISNEGDTIEALAAIVGLDPKEYKKWASKLVPIPKKGKKGAQKYCAAKVPNTVVAFWAGNVGALGRLYVDWNKNVKKLKSLGYYVYEEKESEHEIINRYSYLLKTCADTKALIGTYFWGHGSFLGLYGSGSFYSSNDKFQLDYDDFQLSYKIKFSYIYACDSNAGKDVLKSFLWFGYDGVHNPFGSGGPWNPDYTYPANCTHK